MPAKKKQPTKPKQPSYKMKTHKFVEIWEEVLRKQLMGKDMTILVREAFDGDQDYNAVTKYPNNEDIWKKIKNKMLALRKAATSKKVNFSLPSIRYDHPKTDRVVHDYASMFTKLDNAANPAKGDDYQTGVHKKRELAKSEED